MTSEHNLLFGALDGGSEVQIVSVLELLARLMKPSVRKGIP